MTFQGDRVAWWLLCGWLAACLTVAHVGLIDNPNRAIQQEVHSQILNGTAEKPYHVRVLQPLIVQAIVDHVPARRGPLAFTYSYALIRLVSLFVTFLAFELLLVEFVSVGSARATVLLLAFAHVPTFLNYLYQPTSVVDLAFLAIGMLCVVRGWDLWLLPIILIATANRNSSIFIIGVYFFWHLSTWPWRKPRMVIYTAVLGACWAIESWLLGRHYPGQGWVEAMPVTIRYNLTSPSVYLLAGLMLLPAAIALAWTWNSLPAPVKRLLPVAVLYVVLHLVRGRGNEPRLLLPLYVLLGPVLAIAWQQRVIGEKNPAREFA